MPEPSGRVSVVLLTYNCGPRLEPILDRLEALSVPVIAVDNASSDDTVRVLRHRGVELIQLPENIGAAARNVGVERARTPYVATCDDDGWFEADGLEIAADLLDRHPDLALVNARILVGADDHLDPISAEMADSPLPSPDGLPGAALLGFMAGAVVVRRTAYLEVGGYDPRFFIGGEEETLSFRLAKAGWRMQYVPDVVVHHLPSLANVTQLRGYGLRNTLWNAWLHRRSLNALRWTAFTLADRPKNRDWLRGLGMAIRGLPWVLRERAPMGRDLDEQLRVLDRRRYAERRPVLTRRDWEPPSPVTDRPDDHSSAPTAVGGSDPEQIDVGCLPSRRRATWRTARQRQSCTTARSRRRSR
ncbi:MAG TPA: glycosyltransferase [Microlunatus sp.]|nr:glycosyltransferase [Microlunatus sp.]